MIDIVEYSTVHADGVVDLILPIQQSEFNLPVTLDAQPDLQNIPGFYQHGTGNFWVALDGNKVIGSVALLDIENYEVALRKMFVSARYRGQEHMVSSRLLDEALRWCGSNGVRQVYLGTTAQFFAAHRFYEKNGFSEINKTSLPKTFPIMSVDTKFYRRETIGA